MSRPRVVIVGAGFAGYRTARTLARPTRNKAEIVLLNPTDYFLYLPLLPQVASGVLEPRRVTVSLTGTLPGVRLVLGEADRIDLDRRTVHYTDPEGGEGTLSYDRLVLAAGSVNKLLPVPGVAEHAHGFRGLPEALYLRDHVIRQVELAAATDDPGIRAARCTFVVVGAGYTGTEVAAHGQLFTDALVRGRPLRGGVRPRWMLIDIASRVLPEMDERLSRTADRVLRQRGVDVRTGTSVKEATRDGVLLSDGDFVGTRSLVWCVGVRPDPLAEQLGLPMERGRLLVEPSLRVPGRPEVFACGDAAAVPDLEKPGQYTPMTAQHAWRQGRTAGRNVAASLGVGDPAPYRHRDLGFVVDLGGVQAAANLLGVPLSGPLAGAVTRGYHLAAMPGNRIRVAADWLLDAALPRQGVQLGIVRSWSVPLDTSSPELPRMPGGPHGGTAPDGEHPPKDGEHPSKDGEHPPTPGRAPSVTAASVSGASAAAGPGGRPAYAAGGSADPGRGDGPASASAVPSASGPHSEPGDRPAPESQSPAAPLSGDRPAPVSDEAVAVGPRRRAGPGPDDEEAGRPGGPGADRPSVPTVAGPAVPGSARPDEPAAPRPEHPVEGTS
ncbi:FAD-dependent oxidoreductase [Streptomyces sp. BV286]|uniref:NAD(P)/FAD-dependent oxidoreductase n=1 Tax=Streptomyces sp. BV286 TaxID=2849672 RepID=UPI001C2E6C85|nr:NAD(P)/FAD-dependent oxidoreductase [Streptomyces sp. BV286]MBV1935499.1 FAD-dependent oxidoreductase [Streptomyces sp. BV286]